jgi:AcrR family transcriptional regulator
LFYEKGFHGVGVDEIGERVGISGPALYRHFKGKDEILASLFNEAVEELISATAVVYRDPRRDLERLIRHHVEFAINHRHLVNVYEREEKSLADPWKSHFQRRERHYASRWEDALRRCFPNASSDDIAAAAQAAIGMIHSVAHWPRASRKSPDLPELLFRLVTHGLASLEMSADVEMPGAVADANDAEVPLAAKPPKPARQARQRGSRSRAA